ncbi:MAG TPA: hypothetical protein GXX29_13745 [Firmicutes bacterium]|nr:hypothetical protein [Bacillota bacterium]
MIFHTIIPPEYLYEQFCAVAPALQTIDIGGLKMQVEQGSAGWGRIVRLFSTNPNDYLNPRFAPGSWIDLRLLSGKGQGFQNH